MQVLLFIAITIATFIGMEAVAWLTHKYVMHGFLWYLHKDHHQPTDGPFEKNDAFFIIFAVPSMLLFYLGFQQGQYFFTAIALGILLYGLAYFIVHDVFIHRRLPYLKNSKFFYFIQLRRAHKTHHRHKGKEEGECFGMLWVPKKIRKKSKA